MLCVLGAKVSCLIIIIKLLQVSGQADAKGRAGLLSHHTRTGDERWFNVRLCQRPFMVCMIRNLLTLSAEIMSDDSGAKN